MVTRLPEQTIFTPARSFAESTRVQGQVGVDYAIMVACKDYPLM